MFGGTFLWGEDVIPQKPVHPVGEKQPGPLRPGGDGTGKDLGRGIALPQKDLPSQGQVGDIGAVLRGKTLLPERLDQLGLNLHKGGTGGGGEIPDPALKAVEALKNKG